MSKSKGKVIHVPTSYYVNGEMRLKDIEHSVPDDYNWENPVLNWQLLQKSRRYVLMCAVSGLKTPKEIINVAMKFKEFREMFYEEKMAFVYEVIFNNTK